MSKIFKTTHESKYVANRHIIKIKNRGGEVYKTIKNGKIILEYSFPSDTIKSGKYVWDYFIKYGSENHSEDENPMFDYKNGVLKNNYIEKDISINKLINNDVDLESFINSENDFKDDWKKGRLVNTNIIIGNSSYSKDVVIDGYHRIFQTIINGDEKVKAFVPLKSKFSK